MLIYPPVLHTILKLSWHNCKLKLSSRKCKFILRGDIIMSLKKRAKKSIALALVGVTLAIPYSGAVSAMEKGAVTKGIEIQMKKYKILGLLINLILLISLLKVSNHNIVIEIFLHLIIFINILKDLFNKSSKYVERLVFENKKFLVLLGYVAYFLIMECLILIV